MDKGARFWKFTAQGPHKVPLGWQRGVKKSKKRLSQSQKKKKIPLYLLGVQGAKTATKKHHLETFQVPYTPPATERLVVTLIVCLWQHQETPAKVADTRVSISHPTRTFVFGYYRVLEQCSGIASKHQKDQMRAEMQQVILKPQQIVTHGHSTTYSTDHRI
jgi:hypothetical protein